METATNPRQLCAQELPETRANATESDAASSSNSSIFSPASLFLCPSALSSGQSTRAALAPAGLVQTCLLHTAVVSEMLQRRRIKEYNPLSFIVCVGSVTP